MKPTRSFSSRVLTKLSTGVTGLDEILDGGLPEGRASLVCGGAGCGKTLIALQFVLHGARDLGEPGVIVTFEETPAELATNVASLGFDLDALVEQGLVYVDHVELSASEIEETGEYNLEALMLRIGYAIDAVGARRIAIDTLEALFSAMTNTSLIRSELQRLLHSLKSRGLTVLITGERADGALTRYGIEEYVSDCVILLDNRVEEQVSTRRLRVVKYRGSHHGTNEYPFVINEDGFSVNPITSLRLEHAISFERVSTGITPLDEMLGGKGYFRGSSIMLTGAAGSGKTSVAAHFADAACRRGERCLYLLFEESPEQVLRNMQSIGLELRPWVEKGLLRFYASRPTHSGLQQHLAALQALVREFEPRAAVIDPASNLGPIGSQGEIAQHHLRQLDFLKSAGVTTLTTVLTDFGVEEPQVGISSIVDTWIVLRTVEVDGELNRTLHLVKSRGMAHSNQIREFVLTDHGVDLVDVYLGENGILTGSARLKQEQRDQAEHVVRAGDLERARQAFQTHSQSIGAEIARLNAELELEAAELAFADETDKSRERSREQEQRALAFARDGKDRDPTSPRRKPSPVRPARTRKESSR